MVVTAICVLGWASYQTQLTEYERDRAYASAKLGAVIILVMAALAACRWYWRRRKHSRTVSTPPKGSA